MERRPATPDEARALVYDELFAVFTALHDHFGRRERQIMHGLRSIRRRAHASSGAEVVA